MYTKIKYDKKSIKLLIMATLIGLVLLLSSWLLIHFEVTGTELVCLFSLYIGFGVFVFSGLNLIAAFIYKRRLRKHGYEMPVDGKVYHNRLEELPREQEYEEHTKKHRGSLTLCILFGIIFLVLVVWNVSIYLDWNYPNSGVAFLCGVLMVLDLFWFIAAFLYGRQMNQDKYRDDVEIDSTRKERISLEKGILIACVMLVFTVFVKNTAQDMLDYVFEAQVSSDHQMVSDVCVAICTVYEEKKGTSEGEEMYEMLSEGFYISDFYPASASCWDEVAEIIGVSDFSQLQNKMKVADGPAKIYVKIDADGYLNISFENPFHKVEYPIQTSHRIEK